MKSLVVLGVLALAAAADVEVAPIFGDGMVVQREQPIPVWGRAEPGERVRVQLGPRSASTVAGQDGRWRVHLEALKARGPFDLHIRAGNEVLFREVLVGDVWLCSGQSNMEWPLSAMEGGELAVARATRPDLRLFQVRQEAAEEPASEISGSWAKCRPESAAGFSAVGYVFGRELAEALGVPIGLVQATWGGTPAEAWTARACMEAEPRLAGSLGRPARQSQSRPAALFNGMIAPLSPFAIRGVVWYQGEANVSLEDAYRLLFPALIRCWRTQWAREDMPFLFVQLAGYGKPADRPGDSAWARLREAQAAALELRHVGMAVAIDVGDEDIHPRDKLTVGRRLALVALSKVYAHSKTDALGPRFAKLDLEDGSARVSFANAQGLAARGGPPSGFAIAGEDRLWHAAQAKIEGECVVLSSPAVPRPVAVRYAWADRPEVNLYDAAGLPAEPFRTDDWPAEGR
jgi:sialate O-acetylesterase